MAASEAKHTKTFAVSASTSGWGMGSATAVPSELFPAGSEVGIQGGDPVTVNNVDGILTLAARGADVKIIGATPTIFSWISLRYTEMLLITR